MSKKVVVKLVVCIDDSEINMITADLTESLKDQIEIMINDNESEQAIKDGIIETVWGEYQDGNIF